MENLKFKGALVLLLLISIFLVACDGSGEENEKIGDLKDDNLDRSSMASRGDIANSVNKVKTDSSSDTSTSSGTTSSAGVSGSRNFNLLFKQTKMACDSCGIWFTSMTLEIMHSQGKFTESKSGDFIVKQGRNPVPFTVSLASIPAEATINRATLYMNLHTGEGIANSDSSSVLTVYDASTGETVRQITAGGDIKGRDYSKSNPRVPIDFTAYAKQVHGK